MGSACRDRYMYLVVTSMQAAAVNGKLQLSLIKEEGVSAGARRAAAGMVGCLVLMLLMLIY